MKAMPNMGGKLRLMIVLGLASLSWAGNDSSSNAGGGNGTASTKVSQVPAASKEEGKTGTSEKEDAAQNARRSEIKQLRKEEVADLDRDADSSRNAKVEEMKRRREAEKNSRSQAPGIE